MAGPVRQAIVDKAEKAFRARVAGRSLSELKEADLLLMELVIATLDYLDEHSGDAKREGELPNARANYDRSEP